jgi:pyruvate dehydrogenase E2 component (dihydrolipoamide acetyltransferase)
MAEERIKPIVMPKWGLSMREGKITAWLKSLGSRVALGDAILEVETDKIASAVEAGSAGTLRRIIGQPDAIYAVKALIGVLAEDDVADADVDAFVSGYTTPAAEMDDEEAGPGYQFTETPAGLLRFAKRGEGGEVVVLVHGFGGDLDNWLFNIDALATEATVYALDLPGHGQSSKSVAEPSLKGLSRALIDFMDKLSITDAHLVGHSMGGAVVARAALDAPQRVKSLTLISSAGLGQDINGGYVEGFVTSTSRRDLKPVLEQLFDDPGLVNRQFVEDVLKYKRLDGVQQALSTLSAALFPNGQQADVLAGELANAGKPALVIWGANDRVIPAKHAGALGEAAKAEVIEEAGHMVQMEKAGKVNDLVLAHIRS